jgi:hypothetical protein
MALFMNRFLQKDVMKRQGLAGEGAPAGAGEGVVLS